MASVMMSDMFFRGYVMVQGMSTRESCGAPYRDCPDALRGWISRALNRTTFFIFFTAAAGAGIVATYFRSLTDDLGLFGGLAVKETPESVFFFESGNFPMFNLFVFFTATNSIVPDSSAASPFRQSRISKPNHCDPLDQAAIFSRLTLPRCFEWVVS